MKSVEEVFKKISKVGQAEKVRVYVVGGYIRDILLGREGNRDIDCVCVGSGLEFARSFDTAVKQVGSLIEFPDFDTARYILEIPNPKSQTPNTIVIEFAGARAESYDEKSRKPIVAAATLEQDLARRDFTVNAMALPVELLTKKVTPTILKIQLIDIFDGRKDLENRLLRTPLDPDTTFSDDPLRTLRAVRFAGQLGFSIEPGALESIHRNRARIKIISGERIQEELLKMMTTEKPSIALTLLFQTKLLDEILPEVSALRGVEEVFGHQHKDNLVHSFMVVDNIAEQSEDPWLRLAGLFHDIGKTGTKKFIPKVGWTFHGHEHLGKKLFYGISKRLKLSKERTDYIAKLIRWHLQPIGLMDEGITDSAVRRLVVTMGDELDDLLILGRGDITTGNPNKKVRRLKNYDNLKNKIAELLEKDKLSDFQSPLRGDEIMSLSKLKPGPTVGRIKSAIEEAILDGIIPNEYEAAKGYFEKIKDKYLEQATDWEKM
ncbi:MAG: HD domain-containing protein [Patescibacteria group bacterium]